MKALCKILTPFIEKFGAPRQSLLIEEAWGKLVFPKNDFYTEAFRGLENFSHLWLIFGFHQIEEENVKALVRPPRFENKMKLGVFATRSPHRPNRLGLSVVKFERVEITENEVILWVLGVDLVSGTPIYDIKPYLPYVDSVQGAETHLFNEGPIFEKVFWDCPHDVSEVDRVLIEKVIGLDPRPAHQKLSHDHYGVSLAGYNIQFFKDSDGFHVTQIEILKS
ncbi:MAG: tRNA (N6-threonylcarbamoyladenosine(37)-N6)-methyltransferase TrmO [Bacteriovoracaceae bacterium]